MKKNQLVLTLLTVGSLLAADCLLVPSVTAEDTTTPEMKLNAPAEPVSAPLPETDIRADKVDVDFNAGNATFTGNVRVTDGNMNLQADHLTVHFTRENSLTKIEAKGNVIILEPGANRRATAGMAIYDVTKGTVTLSDNPRLEMAENRVENAKSITYFVDNERVIIEGAEQEQPVIKFQNKGGNQGLNFLR